MIKQLKQKLFPKYSEMRIMKNKTKKTKFVVL